MGANPQDLRATMIIDGSSKLTFWIYLQYDDLAEGVESFDSVRCLCLIGSYQHPIEGLYGAPSNDLLSAIFVENFSEPCKWNSMHNIHLELNPQDYAVLDT